jgi:peptidoglycan/xylan/chitin deacetylase (PgdA/CDA1 family)
LYFGSVRFFKHLIIVILLAFIIIPVIICALLSAQNDELGADVSSLQGDVSSLNAELSSAESALANAAASALTGENTEQVTVATVPAVTTRVTTTPAPVTSPDEIAETTTEPAPSYQTLYPDLTAPTTTPPAGYDDDEHYIYLSFDDGPSVYTDDILNYLKTYNIKATFFVVPTDTAACEQALKRMADEGHTIGIHTFSHDYAAIYADVDSYLADFKRAYDIVYKFTGVTPFVFRFPGGSINDYNTATRDDIVAEMARRGFVYFDWNVDSRDAYGANWTSMYNTVLDGAAANKRSVVLFHNRENTVLVLEDIIKRLQTDPSGYIFSNITPSTRPMHF